MSKALTYCQQALGSSGFAVLNSEVAILMRPDLWTSGAECAGDFALAKNRAVFGAIQGCTVFIATLSGIAGPVTILSRSPYQLEDRIEWLTGREVTDLMAEREAPAPPRQAVPPRAGDARNLGDLYAGVQTANAPRTCGTCARLSSVGTCIAAAESGVRSPGVNIPRRCPAYDPGWGRPTSATAGSCGRNWLDVMTIRDLSPTEVRAAEAVCVVDMQLAMLEIVAADAEAVHAQVSTMSADAGRALELLRLKVDAMLADIRGLAMDTILGEELAIVARRGMAPH